ncbi:MAG: GTP-binding protein [Promethearchaeota archaeon]
MFINYGKKMVQTKIVYYGPAMSGKTTSLRTLFKLLNKDSHLQSIETTTGRTLFFDFGSLDFKGLEWYVKIYLYSTTGQDFYQSTRPATLAGTDGIIFILDSQEHLLKYNKYSWQELLRYFPDKIKKIPVIICLNKYDYENKITKERLEEEFNLSMYDNVEVIPSIATEGYGVKEAFSLAMKKIFPNFSLNI